jgi:predicted ATPase
MIRTPDQRLRVFVSSTLGELAEERLAARRSIESLRLAPVMFELGARPHPPRELYRAYLAQSDVFVGIYWQRYGWVAPGESVSGLEDEYRLADRLPQLLYIKHPAPDREPALTAMLRQVQDKDRASYRRFSTPEELEQLVAQDLALLLSERFTDAQGRRTTSRRAAPLPAPLTRTVGRENEVGRIVELLDSGVRLVTVTGPGGVGKTRIAVEAGHVVARRPGAEVSFVPLAAVYSPSQVLPTVADQLEVRDVTATSPFDSLVEYFADREALVLLDNLEQVVAVGPELARLLEKAPGLRFLATSRQALRVIGEHEFAAAPLGLPSEAASLSELRHAPSVQLLLERARERGAMFDLSGENCLAVTRLCRRLAGLPLAIELAVPRLRLLGPQGLLDRLSSTMDLPPAGDDLPSRQRTLRAALAWSYELLDETEASVFARMSVFAGGATLDGVQAVCSDGQPVEPVIASLLDKSLLVVGNPLPNGELRIQMLEPVRDFASERLDELGDRPEIRRRHLHYLADLGREAAPFLCGPQQWEWAVRFDGERANLRTAVDAGFAMAAYDVVLRLTWDAIVYYYIRDAVDEPREWITRLSREAVDLTDTQQALLEVAMLLVGEAPPDRDPIALLEDATGVFDKGGLPLEAAVSRHNLGLHLWYAGRRSAAFDTLEEASGRYAVIDHDWGVAHVEMTLGAAHASVGRPDEARTHFRKSLDRARCIDNRHEIAQALYGLALVDAISGRPDLAVDALSEAARLVVETHSITGATFCLEALGAVLLARGDPGGAVRLIGAARTIREQRNIPLWTATADFAELVLAPARDELAPEVFAEHWRSGTRESLDVFQLLSTGLALLAEKGLPGDTTAPATL